MKPPVLPDNFYPDEPEDERINRWLTLEAEAAEMQRHELQQWEEPRPPRIPRWLAGCTNDVILWQYGG